MTGILKQLKTHAPAVLIVGLIIGYVLYQQFPVRERLTIGGRVLKDGDAVECSGQTIPNTTPPKLQVGVVYNDKIQKFSVLGISSLGGLDALYALLGPRVTVTCDAATAGPNIT